jgi:hypothetical protein
MAYRDGQVRLSGTVEDRRTKWLAEAVAEEVRGVVEFNNELRVERGGEDWRARAIEADRHASSPRAGSS